MRPDRGYRVYIDKALEIAHAHRTSWPPWGICRYQLPGTHDRRGPQSSWHLPRSSTEQLPDRWPDVDQDAGSSAARRSLTARPCARRRRHRVRMPRLIMTRWTLDALPSSPSRRGSTRAADDRHAAGSSPGSGADWPTLSPRCWRRRPDTDR